jgi:osmoprotectant transport system permease protein
VLLAGALIGACAFFPAFVSLRPNRLVRGEPYALWQTVGWPAAGLLAALWLLAGITALLPRSRRSLAGGITGSLIIFFVLLSSAFGGGGLIAPGDALSRFSLGAGAWLMLGAAALLVLKAAEDLKAEQPGSERGSRPAAGALFLTATLGMLVFLLATGRLNGLGIVKEYQVRSSRFLGELSRHLLLSLAAVAGAALIGIPLGILSYRKKLLRRPVFFAVNSIQTVPSLALFGIMIAPLSALSRSLPFLRALGVRGIGWAPALLALTLYALLPVTRNTYTSLKILDPHAIEAGRGMGMSRLQLLLRVEIPLSAPIILGGVRIALVQSIGNTTVAALIGAGGLGTFVFQGLGQAVPDLILLGALPVIALATAADRIMRLLVGWITPRGLVRQEGRQA